MSTLAASTFVSRHCSQLHMGMNLSFLLKRMQWSGFEHFAGGMHGFLMDETQGREG